MDVGGRASTRTRRSYYTLRNQDADLLDWDDTAPVTAPQYGTSGGMFITGHLTCIPEHWEPYPDISLQCATTASCNQIPPALPPRAYQMPPHQHYLGPTPIIIEDPLPSPRNGSYNPFIDEAEPTQQVWKSSPLSTSLSTLTVTDEYSDMGGDSTSEENFDSALDLPSPRSIQTAQDQKVNGRRQRRKAKKKEAQAAKKKKKNAEKKKKNKEKEKENAKRSASSSSKRALPSRRGHGPLSPPEETLTRGDSHSTSRCRRMSQRLSRSWSSANVLDRKEDSKIDHLSYNPPQEDATSESDPDQYSAVVIKQRRLSGMFALPRRKSSRKLDTEVFGDLGLSNGGD